MKIKTNRMRITKIIKNNKNQIENHVNHEKKLQIHVRTTNIMKTLEILMRIFNKKIKIIEIRMKKMKIIEIHLRILKVMKILEIHMRIMKTMTIN